MDSDMAGTPDPVLLEDFWRAVRPGGSDPGIPQSWAFGATASQADQLLALVVAGTKTATASALRDYVEDDEPLPREGQLNIILDGDNVPRALVRTTSVRIVPFDEVESDHAWREGEGDRSLAEWRSIHQRFFTDHASHDRGFVPEMPVVLERFELLYPRV